LAETVEDAVDTLRQDPPPKADIPSCTALGGKVAGHAIVAVPFVALASRKPDRSRLYPRMPVDVATVRHRFYVLDLLPAPLAPADSRQVGHGGIRWDFTETMATGDPS